MHGITKPCSTQYFQERGGPVVLARWFLASLKALDTKHPQRPFAQSHDDRLECPPLQSSCCAASLPCFQVPRIVLTIAHTVHGSSRVIRYCQDRWYRPQARSRMSLTLHEECETGGIVTKRSFTVFIGVYAFAHFAGPLVTTDWRDAKMRSPDHRPDAGVATLSQLPDSAFHM